jgi:effector-binding domain-containing protein
MTVQATVPESVSTVERPPQPALVLEIEGAVTDIPRLMGDAFGTTLNAFQHGGGVPAGPPFARYLEFGRTVRAEVGFPFRGALTPQPPLRIVELPGGRLVTTTHVGPYESIGEAWDRATGWMTESGTEAAGPPWECYLTGPEEPGPPVTQIFWPVR